MDGYVTIGTELDTKSFDAQINYVKSQLDTIEDKLKQADMGFEVGDTQKLEAEYERLTDKLRNLIKKKEEFNKTDFSGIQSSIGKVGNSVEKVTKKVGRWALAVFGIRSIYLGIRSAMSTLGQYDEQMATNVEWIRYLLATALKPVIETIIQLAYKLLVYINYIAKAWFGVNLFANASTKAFQKQNKAMGGTTKKAKELQKTLASFDEMNILQKDGSVKSGGGSSLPSFPDMGDIKMPWWIEWIASHRNEILSLLAGVASALVLIKLGVEGIFALGIGAIIAGVLLLIQDIVKFIQDPSWQNFITILTDIGIIIGGIMLLMGNWWGLLVVVVALIVRLVVENWDKIKEILGKVGQWIYDHVIKPVVDFFSGLWNGIKNGVTAVWNGITDIFGKIATWVYDHTIGPIVKWFTELAERIGKFFGWLDEETANHSAGGGGGGSIGGGGGGGGSRGGNAEYHTRNFRFAKGGIVLPKLAAGGIINQPSRGIPLGSAIGGESGAEGVIPLTDSQQMELLGEAIGRYISINLTNITELDGRQIARKVDKVRNNQNFVMNR